MPPYASREACVIVAGSELFIAIHADASALSRFVLTKQARALFASYVSRVPNQLQTAIIK
jgi:hypothetical protein